MVFEQQRDLVIPFFKCPDGIKMEQVYCHALYWVKTTVNYKMRPLTILCDFEKALHHTITLKFSGGSLTLVCFTGNMQPKKSEDL